MLPKTHRLSRPDFNALKNSGKPLRFPPFSLIYSTNTLGHNRFAIVTSAKLAKKAVDRNRLRRRLYKAAPLSGSFDLILLPSQSMLNLSHEDAVSLLNQALSKITPRKS